MKRTERRGILIENHDYDQGYWARYDDESFDPQKPSEWRLGWIACDTEIKEERNTRRLMRAQIAKERRLDLLRDLNSLRR